MHILRRLWHGYRVGLFSAQLNVREQLSHLFAKPVEKALKHIEGFRAVFVQRVALTIGAQANSLPQMVERQQVVLPGLVENLQQQAFLGEAPQVSTIGGNLASDHLV